MKLTFEEKKLLYTYGCADLELTRKRLCGVAGLTVDPDQNKLVLDFCRKLEDETLADWYDQMFYFVRSEMEHYTMMQKMSRDIEEDEDWGPTIFDETACRSCHTAPGGVPAEGKGGSWRGDVSGQGRCAGYPACAGILKAITNLLW